MVKVVVGVMGSTPFGLSANMSTPDKVQAFLDVCARQGVKEIDTARTYADGESERILGQIGAGKQFAVATKINILKGGLRRDAVLASVKQSLEALKVNQLDLLYIHRPERTVPLEETLEVIDLLYKEGIFKRFGICNYKAEEVQEIHDICSSKAYVLPTVYQGIFNPLARNAEFMLFPTLRKLGMHFYAFGPTAAGMLAKPIEQILAPAKGDRFDALPFLKMAFGREATIEQVKRIHNVCAQAGLTTVESTLRWLLHHSALQHDDAVLLGASSAEQIQVNLQACQRGPLPDDVALAFSDMWSHLDADATPYHQ